MKTLDYASTIRREDGQGPVLTVHMRPQPARLEATQELTVRVADHCRLVRNSALDDRSAKTLHCGEYLAKGGRIGRAAAWAGELLHIKPILTIADGEVVPLKRVRGNRKAFLEFERAFTSAIGGDGSGARVCQKIAASLLPCCGQREEHRNNRPATHMSPQDTRHHWALQMS